MRTETTYRGYHDLPSDLQEQFLRDIVHEVVDSEVENMTAKLTNETYSDAVRTFKFIYYFLNSVLYSSILAQL